MRFYNRIDIRLLFCLISGMLLFLPALRAQVKEPYLPIHDGSFSAPRVKESPDPLISYRWQNPAVSDDLQTYTLQPVTVKGPDFIHIPPVSRINTDGINITGKGDLFFDFGVESAGWLEFESDDLQDSVEMSISEYNEPAIVNEGAQSPVKTKIPAKYGHTYRLELNDQLYEGVRFGWIHIKQFTKPWHIKKIGLVCQTHPVNYNGSFWCNDSLFTRIWYTGAYTVKLNLLKDYFGAILMERSDRQSWTGDAYPAQAASLVAFGNDDMVKANLLFTSSRENNGIPSYSLYWVLSLIDYVYYSGDTAFFNRLAMNADNRLTDAYRQYDSLQYAGYMGWDERLGAGFENPRTTEAWNTYHMLCIKTWSRFAKALRDAGNAKNRQLAAKYENYAAAKAGLLQDSVLKRFNIFALSEALDGGSIKNEKLLDMAAHLFADRNNRLSYSPFNQYFIIQAMATGGFYPEALATIRDCWGGQILYGGTSFFEVYRPSWNDILKPNDAPPNNQCGYTSLAHPWSAGVTQWLTAELLGIKPVGPGFKTFTILPHPGSGITQVKGQVPTPYGLIKASFDAVSGNCSVTVPPGTTASRIGIPKMDRKIKSIAVNGKWIYTGKNKNTPEDGRFIYLRKVKPGTYRIKVHYETNESRSARSAVKEDRWKFAITHFSTDSITSGSWQGHYGKKGYFLFGYRAKENAVRLPAYIQSVTHEKNAVVVWDSAAADGRALRFGINHKAAAIITQDPHPTWQTMTIDIKATDTLAHALSLYFVDYDRKQRRTAIEIFNLDNLDLIAPVQMIRHYENGKYIRFSCKGSIRIRINQVRGANAAVSGLFFD